MHSHLRSRLSKIPAMPRQNFLYKLALEFRNGFGESCALCCSQSPAPFQPRRKPQDADNLRDAVRYRIQVGPERVLVVRRLRLRFLIAQPAPDSYALAWVA